MPHQKLLDQFDQFRDECIWLRICYNMHSTLFQPSNEKLINSTAPMFFTDIDRVLREYIFQRVCVLTDPAKTGKKENLTTNAITHGLDKAGLITPRILALNRDIEKYRDIVLDARNKLISHLDRDAVLGRVALGAHTEAELHEFYENLQEYCDEVGRVLGVGPLDFRVTAGKGDSVDLLRHLEKSVGR